jgi:hypothetical protein
MTERRRLSAADQDGRPKQGIPAFQEAAFIR